MTEDLPNPGGTTPVAPPTGRPWRWLLALAAPFVLCQLILLVTGKTLPAFWAHLDEADHWQLTLWFAERLPHFDAVYPYSATTPLFHLLGACLVRLVGPNLPLARVLNTGFSLVGVLALFGLLRRDGRHGLPTAALLTTVFLTSCYFFSYAFRWLTDDLALTFCILALSELFRFTDPARPDRLRRYLIGCVWVGLAILTRQSYLFLGLPFGITILLSYLPATEVAFGLGGLALAVMPFAGLVLSWHGLFPPDLQTRHASSPVNLYPLSLPLMLLGFYVAFFKGPQLWKTVRSLSPRQWAWPAAAAVLGLVVLALFPLVPIEGRPDLNVHFPLPVQENIPGFAGWIYAVAAHFPKLHHNSLLFWVLLPAGLAALACFAADAVSANRDPAQAVAVLFLVGSVLSSSLNVICAQKYYDAHVLLFLIWHTREEVAQSFPHRLLFGGLILLFCAYFTITTLTMAP